MHTGNSKFFKITKGPARTLQCSVIIGPERIVKNQEPCRDFPWGLGLSFEQMARLPRSRLESGGSHYRLSCLLTPEAGE